MTTQEIQKKFEEHLAALWIDIDRLNRAVPLLRCFTDKKFPLVKKDVDLIRIVLNHYIISKEETNDILDIVDEYTPKDKDGDYLGPLLPFDYAWEIHQIKKEQA